MKLQANFKTIKRLAAKVMGVGISRVRLDPDRIKEADKALTTADVRNLVKAKMITKKPLKGRRKNVKRRRKGAGSRKGAWNARTNEKSLWMAKVRSQRSLLRQMVEEGALEPKHKRKIYMRIKAGMFKSKRALITYLKEAGMLQPDYEPRKQNPKEKRTKGKTTKPETKSREPEPIEQSSMVHGSSASIGGDKS